MKLAVRIGEGDARAARGRETGAQGGAVAAIAVMPHEPNVRAIAHRLGGDGGGAIAAAVIDDDHFVNDAEPTQGIIGFRDGPADAGFFVVGWEYQRKLADVIHDRGSS